MIGDLPESLDVSGRQIPIRTDFRDVLTIIAAFNDPELETKEKTYVCLTILYPGFRELRKEDYAAAYRAAVCFIDGGTENNDAHPRAKPRLMDWEQDERLIFPAINHVAGFETRSVKYIHWWTFLGYFMEVRDGTFAEVLRLRAKKRACKKFEKWEQEFWNDNKDICILTTRLSEAEKEAAERLNRML